MKTNNVTDQSLKNKCVDKPIPTDLAELNKSVRFNINLDNLCDFQPMHMEIYGNTAYTIIGRFKSQKIKGKMTITSLECYAYNLSKKQNKKYKVINIEKTSIIGNMIQVKISLSTDINAVENPFLKEKIEVTKKYFFDFDVDVEVDNINNDKWFEGRICKTNVVFV